MSIQWINLGFGFLAKQTPWTYVLPPSEFLGRFWSAQQASLLRDGNRHTQGVCLPVEAKSQISLLIVKNTVTLFIISCWLTWGHNECALRRGLTLSCILNTRRYKFFTVCVAFWPLFHRHSEDGLSKHFLPFLAWCLKMCRYFPIALSGWSGFPLRN